MLESANVLLTLVRVQKLSLDAPCQNNMFILDIDAELNHITGDANCSEKSSKFPIAKGNYNLISPFVDAKSPRPLVSILPTTLTILPILV